MMRARNLVFALAATVLAPVAAQAAEPAQPQPAKTVPTCDDWAANKGDFRFRQPYDRSALEAKGVRYAPLRQIQAKGYPWNHDVQVSLPPSYGKDPKRSYPVFWTTDGMFMFELATAIVTACAGQGMPEMIVVAVGAASDIQNSDQEMQRRRVYDFSPNEVRTSSGFGSAMYRKRQEANEAKRKADGTYREQPMGGAPRFLSFLADDLRSQLGREYRMNGQHILFGHSGGGMFCGYAFLARPTDFSGFICGSPAWTANDHELFRMEERLAEAGKDLPANLFLGAGEAEVLSKNYGLVSSMTLMAEILYQRQYPSLKLQLRLFPGENHVSVIGPLMTSGLKGVWTNIPAPAAP